MVELESRVETRAGVALVELVVRNPTATARRVRVADRLDGPLWPPRRRGVPSAGWDDGGFKGVVPAGERRALGYASPAPGEGTVSEPPAEIVWTERAGESEADESDALGPDDSSVTADATPEGVVRSLGDPRPPADAVPTPTSRRSRFNQSETDSGRSP